MDEDLVDSSQNVAIKWNSASSGTRRTLNAVKYVPNDQKEHNYQEKEIK